jgi:hypothetical protein
MTTAKFEVEKFDDQNSFSLWRIKMQALLRQQGLAKILEPPEEINGIKVIEEIREYAELEEKAHSAILMSISNGVLREVANEETANKHLEKATELVDEEIPHEPIVFEATVIYPKDERR